jgi:hypothetical protein
LVQHEGRGALETLGEFGASNNLSVQFILFDDTEEWASGDPSLVVAEVGAQGRVSKSQVVSLSQVREVIRVLSGGPVEIGSKGLIYGTSRLECYLSRTDSLWPGDADAVVLDQNCDPLTILEFKKHTRYGNGEVEDQRLSNYYPSPDGRKYDRLSILRSEMEKSPPIVVVYYPTQAEESQVKLELVTGEFGSLQAAGSRMVPLPSVKNPATCTEFLDSCLNMSF